MYFCKNAVHYSTDVSYGATFLKLCSSYNFPIRLPVILLENVEKKKDTGGYILATLLRKTIMAAPPQIHCTKLDI